MSAGRIAYIHGGGGTVGGIETNLARVYKYHSRYEADYLIASPGRFLDYLKEREVPNIFELGGGRLREVSKFWRAVRKAVNLARERQFRAIIANGTHSWIYGGIVSKLSGVPGILYMAGDVRREHFRNPIDAIAFRIRPSFYLAMSEFIARSVNVYLKGRVELLRPYPDSAEFDKVDDTARRAIRAELNISPDAFVICVPGRIQSWKGQDTVLEAWRLLSGNENTAVLFAGECTFASDEPFFKKLQSVAAGDPRVHFLGFRSDVPVIMKASDIVVHASRNPEPFGIVVPEAMLAGKPILATNHGGPPEVIEHGVTGFLYPHDDPPALAALIQQLMADPSMCATIGAQAYRKAASEYTMQASIQTLESLIDQLQSKAV